MVRALPRRWVDRDPGLALLVLALALAIAKRARQQLTRGG
jgi:hypothetical protein